MNLGDPRTFVPRCTAAQGIELHTGDRVLLRHISRPEWEIKATFVYQSPRSVWTCAVRPDEHIDSPANWQLVEKLEG